MAVSLRRQPFEEAGREARSERANGMCRHSSTQQTGERILVDASVNLQQGVAFAIVLCQGRCCCPLVGILWAHHRRGLGVMVVGCPRQRQEEDQGPSRRPPNSEGEGCEGIGDHRRLPHAEGGATDEPRTPPIPDGARGVA